MKTLSIYRYRRILSDKVILVDDDDYEKYCKYKWLINTYGYARLQIYGEDKETRSLYLHREIMKDKLSEGMQVDHIDHNRLNNQKSNLRVCTGNQNRSYKSKSGQFKYKGLSWVRSPKHWVAKIHLKTGHIYLGRFYTPEEAALAYNEAAKKYFGEFACLNIIEPIL